jgi:HPt (histidine-containing phosphotransfer) domain-containing protein
MLCQFIQLYKTTIVLIESGAARAYPSDEQPYIFYCHEQIEALVESNKIAFLNKQAIVEQNIHVSDKTDCACIVPLRKKTRFGFILLESDNMRALTEGTESILIYVAEILSNRLNRKKWEEEREERSASAPEVEILEKAETFISKLKQIEGLEAETALERMGGLEEAYEKTVSLLARLMPETISKMNEYIEIKDLANFRVEIHGIKGVLRNIGATELGNYAASLEEAAYDKNLELCLCNYPLFREELEAFHSKLNAALETETADKKTIDAETFTIALSGAKAAAEDYDAVSAMEALAEVIGCSYSKETDELLKQAIFALEKFDCGEAVSYIVKINELI